MDINTLPDSVKLAIMHSTSPFAKSVLYNFFQQEVPVGAELLPFIEALPCSKVARPSPPKERHTIDGYQSVSWIAEGWESGNVSYRQSTHSSGTVQVPNDVFLEGDSAVRRYVDEYAEMDVDDYGDIDYGDGNCDDSGTHSFEITTDIDTIIEELEELEDLEAAQ